MKDYMIISEDGRFRSSKMQRLAEIFEDYDPELELQWIPPEYRTSDHSPQYRLVHNSSRFGTYVIGKFYEHDDPEQVLARFIAGDTRRFDVLGQLEAQEVAQDAFRMKKWLDEQDERTDMVRMFMSDRNYLHMTDHKGDKVVYDEHRRKRQR